MLDMIMETPRDILNEIKWRYKTSLDEAKIYYIHRGAPGDYRVMWGSEIEELSRSLIKTKDAQIPYHRIFKIEYKEEIILERERD